MGEATQRSWPGAHASPSPSPAAPRRRPGVRPSRGPPDAPQAQAAHGSDRTGRKCSDTTAAWWLFRPFRPQRGETLWKTSKGVSLIAQRIGDDAASPSPDSSCFKPPKTCRLRSPIATPPSSPVPCSPAPHPGSCAGPIPRIPPRPTARRRLQTLPRRLRPASRRSPSSLGRGSGTPQPQVWRGHGGLRTHPRRQEHPKGFPMHAAGPQSARRPGHRLAGRAGAAPERSRHRRPKAGTISRPRYF